MTSSTGARAFFHFPQACAHLPLTSYHSGCSPVPRAQPRDPAQARLQRRAQGSPAIGERVARPRCAAEPRLGALRNPPVRGDPRGATPSTCRDRSGLHSDALLPCASLLCRPEPHILLFRRPQGTDPTTGLVHGKRIDPSTGKVA